MKVESFVNRGGLKIGQEYEVTEAHGRSLLKQGIAREVLPPAKVAKPRFRREPMIPKPIVESTPTRSSAFTKGGD